MAEVTVGSYLFTRLKQLGVETVFGVPGGKYYISRLIEAWYRRFNCH